MGNCYYCGTNYEDGCSCQEQAQYYNEPQYDYADYQQEMIRDIMCDLQGGVMSVVQASQALSDLGVDNLEIVRIVSDIRQDQRDKQSV